MERKSFQDLPLEENPNFLEDGKRIFLEMKNKYPKNTVEDMDNIFNGLLCSLMCLIKNLVKKEDHKYFLQLIYKTIDKNLDNL